MENRHHHIAGRNQTRKRELTFVYNSLTESVDLPLAVDLDGSLINSDLLIESAFHSLSRDVPGTLVAFFGLRYGIARVKRDLAEICTDFDPSGLPFNEMLIEFLRSEKARGREIALVSASDHQLVSKVADYLKLFDWFQGSTTERNLKGERKASYLSDRFPSGFVYVGDSAADMAVWRRANGSVPVGTSKRVQTELDRLSMSAPVERRFDFSDTTISTWARALRIHQWIKNSLILIPLFLSGLFLDYGFLSKVVVGFLGFGLIASGGYLFNDLLDLQADRAHPSKRLRPLAAGQIDPFSAIAVCAGCIGTGLLVVTILSGQAALLALTYLGGTSAYSIWLKRLVLVDLIALAALFTIRLAVGTALIGAAYSIWLMTFSMFFFFSLSAVKRVGELARTGSGSRRGYDSADLSLLQNLGVSMSVSALVIFVLYLEDEALVEGHYPSPLWLWLAPVLIFVWLCRLWLLAVRGKLNDDPVVFALRDPASLAIGVALAFSVLAAHLL